MFRCRKICVAVACLVEGGVMEREGYERARRCWEVWWIVEVRFVFVLHEKRYGMVGIV